MHYYSPLTPTVFLERSAKVFGDSCAISEEGRQLSYAQLLRRSRRLAAVLQTLGVGYGERVAILTENGPEAIEANFGIPGAGGVIVALNPWLPTSDLLAQLQWVECRVLLASRTCLERHPGLLADDQRTVLAFGAAAVAGTSPSALDYETCLEAATSTRPLHALVQNELDPLVINFTSGTTGKPKGVTMSHRAGYLHALGQALMLGLDRASCYLWTLPLFHVNGWGHAWAISVVGASQLLRPLPAASSPDATAFCEALEQARVSHLAGAPRLLRRLLQMPGASHALRGVTLVTGGAAPPPSLFEMAARAGARVIHQYGLNETFGPFVVCEEQRSWADADDASSRLRCRQGVEAIHAGGGLRVVDQEGRDVPADGVTQGEVLMAGNTVALGYYRDEAATARAFVDGWFHSGDVAVVHPDGYLELKDRLKDLICVETDYGWENISSLEIEQVLLQCPGVTDAALIGAPGAEAALELVAVLESEDGVPPGPRELRQFCELRLAKHLRPARFLWRAIPKTATGKVRKDVLLQQVSRDAP